MKQTPYHTLLSRIDSATTVITPNRRLAATLHKLYQAKQIAEQKSAWHTPDILPAISWLQRLWETKATDPTKTPPILLNTLQENYLWEKIVAEETEKSPLLQVSETANTAKSAWGLVKQWDVSLDHPAFYSSEDYATFVRFAERFKDICAKNNVIDQASITPFLTVPATVKNILLVGFTEVTPQLNHLLDRHRSLGCHIEHIKLATQNPITYQTAFRDDDTELLSIARYAKDIYDKDPEATQGYVIPNLDKTRDRVQHVFARVFDNAAAYNISAGKRNRD